jgi:hypothetical protein
MDQKPVRMFLGQRLAELLQGPFGARMLRYIEVQDTELNACRPIGDPPDQLIVP